MHARDNPFPGVVTPPVDSQGALHPQSIFDGPARDSRAIVEHKFEVTQCELANRNGGNPDGYTSDHVGIVESEDSECSS